MHLEHWVSGGKIGSDGLVGTLEPLPCSVLACSLMCLLLMEWQGCLAGLKPIREDWFWRRPRIPVLVG